MFGGGCIWAAVIGTVCCDFPGFGYWCGLLRVASLGWWLGWLFARGFVGFFSGEFWCLLIASVWWVWCAGCDRLALVRFVVGVYGLLLYKVWLGI